MDWLDLLAVQGTLKSLLQQSIKKQRYHFADKDPYSQNYHFPSSHVWMWVWPQSLSIEKLMFLSCGAGEDSWESLDSMEIKTINPKGYQPWIFFGKTAAEAPILWPCDAKSQLIGKDPDAGIDWGQEEKMVTEDEIVGWLHWLNEHEFEQTLGDSEGQGGLACCSPWHLKVLDTT